MTQGSYSALSRCGPGPRADGAALSHPVALHTNPPILPGEAAWTTARAMLGYGGGLCGAPEALASLCDGLSRVCRDHRQATSPTGGIQTSWAGVPPAPATPSVMG